MTRTSSTAILGSSWAGDFRVYARVSSDWRSRCFVFCLSGLGPERWCTASLSLAARCESADASPQLVFDSLHQTPSQHHTADTAIITNSLAILCLPNQEGTTARLRLPRTDPGAA